MSVIIFNVYIIIIFCAKRKDELKLKVKVFVYTNNSARNLLGLRMEVFSDFCTEKFAEFLLICPSFMPGNFLDSARKFF